MRFTRVLALGTSLTASTFLIQSKIEFAKADSIESQWWLRQAVPQLNKESNSKNRSASTTGNTNSIGQPFFTLHASENPNGNVKSGNFAIPGWFACQPKPYERPLEFQQPSMFGVGQGGFTARAPLAMPFAGYGMWGAGVGGQLVWGGRGYYPGWAPGLGFGWSQGWVPGWGSFGRPYPGYGGWSNYGGWGQSYFGNPVLGGVPGFGGWSGHGPYGGFGWGSPAAGALYAGSFGNRMFGWSRNGMLSPTRFNQSMPSKASGNYYEPSTVDPTASGGYYSSGAPAMTPVMSSPGQLPEQLKDYWGPSGNPFANWVSNPTSNPVKSAPPK